MIRFFEICTRLGFILLAPFLAYTLILVGASGHSVGGYITVIVIALYSILLNYLLTVVIRMKNVLVVIAFFVLMLPTYYFFILLLFGVWPIGSISILIKCAIAFVTIIYCIASLYTIYVTMKAARKRVI